jgi:hypothetical protein
VPTTIAEVERAFMQLGAYPSEHDERMLDETLVRYAGWARERNMLPEHLIVSVRAAAMSGNSDISDRRLTHALKVCLERYFRSP